MPYHIKTSHSVQNLSREYGGVFQQAARVSEVCFDSIESAIAHNNSPESLLRGKVRKGLTVAVEAANPGLVYTSLPGSLKQGPDEAIYFHLSFFAKVNGSTNAGPVYVSLCWLEQDQEWGLSRLITDQWLGIKTVF